MSKTGEMDELLFYAHMSIHAYASRLPMAPFALNLHLDLANTCSLSSKLHGRTSPPLLEPAIRSAGEDLKLLRVPARVPFSQRHDSHSHNEMSGVY